MRWTSDSGNDTIYVTADGINGGQWGYNNLQWFGGTYYHKFNDQWHISFEANLGIAPNKNTALIGSADIIIHF